MRRRSIVPRLALGLGLTAAATISMAAQVRQAAAPFVSEHNGAVPTRDALSLHLTADTGSVQIFTDASSEVRYRVIAQAAPDDTAGIALARQFKIAAQATPTGVILTGEVPHTQQLARLQVRYQIHVPRHYDLVIATQAGDIDVQDLIGHATLSTGGGDIRTGRIGAPVTQTGPGAVHELAAALSTAGGHIVTGDINGGLRATTPGGHITTGNVVGDATLHTGGGHIQVGHVSGIAQFYSGGGNIAAERADANVIAETLGGHIEFGAAAGAIRASTFGGQIRIAHVTQPTELALGAGPIYLAGVEAPLRVSTAMGAITAWLSPGFPGRQPQQGGSRRRGHNGGQFHRSVLASGDGDITVYLPRQLAVTIDAQIEHGSDHHIIADRGLPVEVKYAGTADGSALHAVAAVNGGGPTLHLETISGDIHLRLADGDSGQRATEPRQRPAAEHRPGAQQIALPQQPPQGLAPNAPAPNPGGFETAAAVVPRHSAAITRMIEGLWWGGVVVDPAEQQKHLVQSVPPVYPELARQAGIEGDVSLRIVIGRDGAVSDVDVLSGESVLARAALQAVEKWRYEPALLDGSPVNVVTTVTLAFRLR